MLFGDDHGSNPNLADGIGTQFHQRLRAGVISAGLHIPGLQIPTDRELPSNTCPGVPGNSSQRGANTVPPAGWPAFCCRRWYVGRGRQPAYGAAIVPGWLVLRRQRRTRGQL